MMNGRYATPEIVENVLWLSASLPPSESNEAFTRLTAFKPSVSCIQDIISHDGRRLADMLENELKDGISSREMKVPEGTEGFVVSLDGANVLMREKGRKRGRKAKRPGAGNKQKQQAEARRTEGAEEEEGQNTGFRNAMVGSYSCYARKDKIIDIETGLEGLAPHRLESIYSARMPEQGAVGFKVEFEAIIREMSQQLPPKEEVPRFLLLDGARPLWSYVENNPLFADYRKLIDFYHSGEHLSKLAAGLFGEDSAESKEWYERWRYKIKYEEGGVLKMLRSAKSYAKNGKPSKSRAKKMKIELTYFERNYKRMNYAEHMINGWPIGSGPVEAACKSIVKARLCQSGMRWTTEGERPAGASQVRPMGRSMVSLQCQILATCRMRNQTFTRY